MTDIENYDELFELARKAGKVIKSEAGLGSLSLSEDVSGAVWC